MQFVHYECPIKKTIKFNLYQSKKYLLVHFIIYKSKLKIRDEIVSECNNKKA